MSLKNILSMLAIASVSVASPLAIKQHLEGRDDKCYPQNMVTDQRDTTCPHKNSLDSNGHCKGLPSQPGDAGCNSYCELSLAKGYGQEIPFKHGFCQGGISCNVGESESVSTTQTWTINMGAGAGTGDAVSKALTGAFDIGASYSWSKTLTYTTSTLHTKELPEGSCGYWTFIPYVMTSCGTLTTQGTKSESAGYYGTNTYTYCSGAVKDTPNWCNNAFYKDDNGKVDGEVVFVYVDCEKGGVLADKDIKDGKQPASYLYPGVSTGPKGN